MSKRIAVIFVSHKRIQAKGGIESMIKLLIHKCLSLDIPASIVYRELYSVTGIIRGNNIEKNNLFIIKEDKKNVKTLYVPELIFLLVNITFSILASFAILLLIKNYRRNGYSVIIHAMDTVYGGLAALLASLFANAPFITHTHGIRSHFMNIASKSSLVKTVDFLIEKWVVGNSSILISVSKQAADFWIKNGIPRDKVVQIPVFIETRNFAFSKEARGIIRRKLGIAADSIVLGYIGRLSSEKNLFFLVEAFHRANVDAKLIIVGDGLLMPLLKRYVQSKKLENKVIFTGFRNDVYNIINAIDVLVLPSLVEGMPTVILEAYANSKPVIASNISANRELVQNNSEGILFDPYDINQLKDAIIKLCNDSTYRSKLAIKAEKKAKRYGIDFIFPKILNVYKEVLGEHQR